MRFYKHSKRPKLTKNEYKIYPCDIEEILNFGKYLKTHD